LAILTDIDLVLLKRKWKRKELIIFLKLNHPLEYSHPFISGFSVTAAHRTFQFEGGGQHLSPLDSTEKLFSYLNFYYNLKRGM
jgi:hypothetical protein